MCTRVYGGGGMHAFVCMSVSVCMCVGGCIPCTCVWVCMYTVMLCSVCMCVHVQFVWVCVLKGNTVMWRMHLQLLCVVFDINCPFREVAMGVFPSVCDRHYVSLMM